MKRHGLILLALLVLLSGCRGAQTTLPSEPEPPATVLQTQPTDSTLATDPAPSTDPTLPIEPPAPPPEPEDEDFVRVADHIPGIRQALAYATANNFTGCRIYDFTDAYLRYGTVKKLAQVCSDLQAQGLGLVIWDGFRPAAAQAKLWEICPDPTFVSHPITGKRTHCRGNTVDITLYDLETGAEVPVPTGYDHFTAYADRDYSDCSPEAAANARLLEQTMEKHGFVPYFSEWWHFSDAQDYPVDEYFNPAIPTGWTANCTDYITLRDAPDGTAIARIPAGSVMQLQSWQGKYAKVLCGAREGYVMTNYIMPREDTYFTDCLDTVAPTHVYSYAQMTADMAALQKQYPEVVTIGSIGASELGRDIPVLRLGNPEAKYHILLQGAIHGREHLTAWLLMAMADYWLDHGILGYGDVCYHIIPMSNPDGVILAQTGTMTEAQREIYRRDLELGYTTEAEAEYAGRWKANGLGVDINRNFPAGWEAIDDRTGPSSQKYQGSAPFCAAEAAALRDYTLRFSFDATISYHATGSLIYYEYGDNVSANRASKILAQAVQEVCGYEPTPSIGTDGAGYKDWVIEALGIPSLTIEIGCEEAALAQREIYSIFVRNYRLLPALARWLQIP